MFGLFKKPKNILGMLENFGISIDTMIPQLESLIIEKGKQLEAEACAPITGVITFSDDKTHLVFSLYKITDPETGKLELWRSFPLNDMVNVLNNLNKEDADTTAEPVTTIDTTTADIITDDTGADSTDTGSDASDGV